MAVMTTTTASFAHDVLQAEVPVLVDFYADWCNPCRMLSPIIEEVSETRPDVRFCKVNVDEQMEVAQRYQVSSIPMLLLFHQGKVVDQVVGLQSKSAVLDLIQQAL